MYSGFAGFGPQELLGLNYVSEALAWVWQIKLNNWFLASNFWAKNLHSGDLPRFSRIKTTRKPSLMRDILFFMPRLDHFPPIGIVPASYTLKSRVWKRIMAWPIVNNTITADMDRITPTKGFIQPGMEITPFTLLLTGKCFKIKTNEWRGLTSFYFINTTASAVPPFAWRNCYYKKATLQKLVLRELAWVNCLQPPSQGAGTGSRVSVMLILDDGDELTKRDKQDRHEHHCLSLWWNDTSSRVRRQFGEFNQEYRQDSLGRSAWPVHLRLGVTI